MSVSELNPHDFPISESSMLFPIKSLVASYVLSSFTIFDNALYSKNLNEEVSKFRSLNPSLLRHLFARYDSNGSSPLFHGALVMHAILREQASSFGRRLPAFNHDFPHILKVDRKRRIRLFSEACAIPVREVAETRRLARYQWFVNHEPGYHSVLEDPLEPRTQEYVNDFYQGGVGFYYTIKDGLALPEAYS